MGTQAGTWRDAIVLGHNVPQPAFSAKLQVCTGDQTKSFWDPHFNIDLNTVKTIISATRPAIQLAVCSKSPLLEHNRELYAAVLLCTTWAMNGNVYS